MLRQTQPTIPWYGPGGLDAMFFCLYQCDREGESPPDDQKEFLKARGIAVFADEHVRKHREPLVRAILADERLTDCFGGVSLQASESMPYNELRTRAIFLNRQIVKWMDGRIIDPNDLPKAGKGKGTRKRRSYEISPCEIASMIRVLESFLGMQMVDGLRPAALILLCYEVDAIVSDERFRKFSWHVRPRSRPYSHLVELAQKAKVSLKRLLRQKGHVTSPSSRRRIMTNQRSKDRPAIPRGDMEKMRYELMEFIKLRLAPRNPPDQEKARGMHARVREILADPRLKGHYGYVTKAEASQMDQTRLWQSATNLEQWLYNWLR